MARQHRPRCARAHDGRRMKRPHSGAASPARDRADSVHSHARSWATTQQARLEAARCYGRLGRRCGRSQPGRALSGGEPWPGADDAGGAVMYATEGE